MKNPRPHNPPMPSEEEALVRRVLSMYRAGWFPMNDPDSGQVQWVQPHSRGIVPLDGRFTVSRSLRSRVRSGRFTIRTDTAFAEVIESCALPSRGRESTWLDDSIIELFLLMHERGMAHSIEAWLPADDHVTERLVGGLYGLALGGVFCGESMFSRPDLGGTDASKVCLVHLVHHLRRRGFALLDAQMVNDHLTQFGCFEMARGEYLMELAAHAQERVSWSPFDPAATVAELSAG